MKSLIVSSIAGLLLLAAAPQGRAQMTLEQLLQQTQRSLQAEGQINRQREEEFARERNRQRELLAQARRELAAETARSDRLRQEFDDNERRLAEFETTLQERLGNLGEMFGVVKQVSGDLKTQFEGSFVSGQIPGRARFVGNIAERKELPTIQELRQLWFEMQREITESGRIVTFTTDIRSRTGETLRGQTVTRVGVFNALHEGQFLEWIPREGRNEGMFAQLRKQPADRFLRDAAAFQRAAPGTVAPLAVDFTRGAILSVVVENPSLGERIEQGGTVGYVTLSLGAIGLLLALFQGVRLTLESMKMNAQLKRDEADTGNALGRVMAVYTENPNIDVETLELKLDEAILRETGRFEWGLQVIKVLYVVAPLLGLLGTVVGMIQTFQMITMFGTGDPKTMAGGISMALVTTVLGLCVAIPLTLLHALLSSRSKALIRVLEEQSAGLVAQLAEKRHGRLA